MITEIKISHVPTLGPPREIKSQFKVNVKVPGFCENQLAQSMNNQLLEFLLETKMVKLINNFKSS